MLEMNRELSCLCALFNFSLDTLKICSFIVRANIFFEIRVQWRMHNRKVRDIFRRNSFHLIEMHHEI